MKFTPDPLNSNCRLYQFRRFLNSNKSIYWCYDTLGPEIKTDLNVGCDDMSKLKVQEIHQEALGYSAAVDPITAPTPFISKSIHQCGEIQVHHENCEEKAGRVYELMLDNHTEMRFFYCRFAENFAVVKLRDEPNKRAYISAGVITMSTPALLDVEKNVERFCDTYEIDFAELDILFTGNLPYIIDVNNIAGNGALWSKIDKPGLATKLYVNQVKSL